jgi:DNA helicase HerA-like ATPase
VRYPDPFEDNGKREILHVVGKTGTGKSTFIREYMLDKHRIIIYDPKEEYAGPIAESSEEMFDYITKHERFMVRTTDIDDLDLICGIAKHIGNVLLVFEEAESIIPQSNIKLPAEMRDIIFRGRKWSVSMLFSSQRPAKIHIDARSQWTRLVIFNGTEPADIEWIESVTRKDLCKTEFNPLNLEIPGEYLDIMPGSMERKKTKVLPMMTLHRKAGREANYKTHSLDNLVSLFSAINR